jgi:hypothetical protein
VTALTAVELPNPAPRIKVAQTGWAVQGRVSNAQSQPVAGFSVFFVDAAGRYLPQFGFAYTDSSGYFVLNYPGSNGRPSAPPELFLEVANTASAPVYRGSSPVQIAFGKATYQSITLRGTLQQKKTR